jgi:hypothetical protein
MLDAYEEYLPQAGDIEVGVLRQNQWNDRPSFYRQMHEFPARANFK